MILPGAPHAVHGVVLYGTQSPGEVLVGPPEAPCEHPAYGRILEHVRV